MVVGQLIFIILGLIIHDVLVDLILSFVLVQDKSSNILIIVLEVHQ